MKKVLAAALLLALGVPASAQQPVFSVTPGYNVSPNPEPTVAESLTHDPLWFALKVEADNGVGSGTPVVCQNGKTLVLTNAHVARQDRTTFTVYASGKAYPARRVDGSRVWNTGPSSIDRDGVDLAVVEVDAELGSVPIAAAAPTVGETLYQWGYGMVENGRPVLRTGTVVRNSIVEPTLSSTINCVSGDSGSGVFNVKGELVGVSHGSAAAYGGPSHYAVPLSEVRKFLGRPVLAKLFPRLADRLEARREARAAAEAAAEAAKAATKAPETPAPKAPAPKAPAPKAEPTPKAAPAAPARMYRVGNGPWMSEAEFRQKYPLAGDCPNGRCPLAPPPAAVRPR